MKLWQAVGRHVAHDHAAKPVARSVHVDGHQRERLENRLHGYCTDFPCNSGSVLRFCAGLRGAALIGVPLSPLNFLMKTGAAEWD